jgi:hypothetical protein
MYQVRSRQIARLEKRALPYIEQRGEMEQQWRQVRRGVVAHATVLAFLVRYGNPQVDEGLSDACRRFAKSEAWKACCEKFPESCKNYRDEFSFEPYNRDRVFLIGDPLRHILISTFPGTNERDKINRTFRSAPPWLMWFTFADYTAELLGLDLPDFSDVKRFQRSKKMFHGWWGLPQGAFEPRPWPHGADGEPLARVDLRLLQFKTDRDARITNRERKRALATSSEVDFRDKIHWPELISAEWLQLDSETKRALCAKSGHPLFAEDITHPEFRLLDPNWRRRPTNY